MPEASNKVNIDHTASLWAAREDLRPLTSQEEEELEAWLQADMRHLGAYGRAKAILVASESLPPDADAASDIAQSQGAVPTARDDDAIVGENYVASITRLGRRRLLLSSLAASFVAMIGGAIWLGERGAADQGMVYQTARGEIRKIALEDGSVLTLNTSSKVRVLFERDARKVDLISGEVFFKVAKDHVRPFTVHNGQYSVRAVGTAFSVRKFDDAVQILVQEGRIRFGWGSPANTAAALYADANMEIVDKDGGARPLLRAMGAPDLARSLAWLDADLSFDETRLREAVLEFQRYSRTSILLSPQVESLSITGRFPASDPVGFAEAVAQVLNLRVERTPLGIRLEQPTTT